MLQALVHTVTVKKKIRGSNETAKMSGDDLDFNELGSMVEVSRYAASLIYSISVVPTTDEPLQFAKPFLRE